MKKFILLLLFAMPILGFSQEPITIVKDTLVDKKEAILLSNGKMIIEGQNIKCGRGTLPTGDFKYIRISATAFAAAGDAIGRQYSGLNLSVKAIQKYGNKKRGYKYYLKVGGGNIVNYQVEIEDALSVGEIVL